MEKKLQTNWIVVHPETGARLCKDKCWREFAMFGTMNWCVKIYSQKGWAQKAATRFSVKGKTHIIGLSNGAVMDASGRIEGDPDYVISQV